MQSDNATEGYVGFDRIVRLHYRSSPLHQIARAFLVCSLPAGSIDFFAPRCILHTHAGLPDNAGVAAYFAGLKLKGGASADTLVRVLSTLQGCGKAVLRWEVHHCDARLSDAVATKVAALAKSHPQNFDLTRKWVPEHTYEYNSVQRTFLERPHQPEGNAEWWEFSPGRRCHVDRKRRQ